MPGPDHHALERRGHQVDRDLGLLGQPVGQAPQQRPSTHQMDALVDDVLGQFGRRLGQALDHGGHDQFDLIPQGDRISSGEMTTVLGSPLEISRPRTSALTSSA